MGTDLHGRLVVVLQSLGHCFCDQAIFAPPMILAPQEEVGIPEPARPCVCLSDRVQIALYLLPSLNEVLLLR